MALNIRVNLDRERIQAFCQHHHIRKLSLFGSVLTEAFDPDRSDVDVLVEFDPGARVGLLRMVQMEDELSHLLGRRVDLRTPGDLSPYFRQRVLETAEVQYLAG